MNACLTAGIRLWLILLLMLGVSASGQPTNASLPADHGFDAEFAARAILNRITPEKRARSNAYFEGGYWIQLWQFLQTVAVAVLLLASGASARMRDAAQKFTRFPFIHTIVYGVLYLLVISLLSFPLGLYTDFFREHQYGLATQGFDAWMIDWAKGLALTLVFGSLLLVVLMAVVRRFPGAWPAIGALVSCGFLVLTVLIAPVYIAPMFNTYKLLSDPKVLNPILRLAHANGIPSDRVYEVDASKQSTRISANVSGLGGTTRICLNDNLLQQCALPEIEAVMAHEMGHYVLNHVHKMLLFLGVVFVAGFGFLRWALETALRWFGPKWRISGISDVAVLPLAAAIFSSYLFALTPIINTWIRTQEIEADIFGLNAARQPDGFAEAALKLADYRKLEPGPWEEFLFYDHPSGATRIRLAMRWKAENLPTDGSMSQQAR